MLEVMDFKMFLNNLALFGIFSFILIFFNTVLIQVMVNKICQRLDLNCGSLVYKQYRYQLSRNHCPVM